MVPEDCLIPALPDQPNGEKKQTTPRDAKLIHDVLVCTIYF